MHFILGLTGGIGSGKSAASAWFEQKGITVVDADIIARDIVEKDQPALQQIHAAFGDEILLDNGELNRAALRKQIFNDSNARKTLERITHPAIRQAIIHQLNSATSPYVVLVSPLLFETNQHQLTDHTLLIDADEALQIERAGQRDGQSIAQIQQIIQVQMPRQQKRALADDIVLNDGHLEYLYDQLKPLHQAYLQR